MERTDTLLQERTRLLAEQEALLAKAETDGHLGMRASARRRELERQVEAIDEQLRAHSEIVGYDVRNGSALNGALLMHAGGSAGFGAGEFPAARWLAAALGEASYDFAFPQMGAALTGTGTTGGGAFTPAEAASYFFDLLPAASVAL